MDIIINEMNYSVFCTLCIMSIVYLYVDFKVSSSVCSFIYHHHRFGLARFRVEMKEQPEKGKGKKKNFQPSAIFSLGIFNKTRS